MLTREFHNHHGYSRERLLSCLQIAKSTMFQQEFVVSNEIHATEQMLKKAGSMDRIPESPCILPAASLNHWEIDQTQIVEQATQWAEKLVNSQNYPVTK